MNEIVFEVTQEADGGLVAECLTESIFTEADSWEELRPNVKEAVAAFYFGQPHPPSASTWSVTKSSPEARAELFLNPAGFQPSELK